MSEQTTNIDEIEPDTIGAGETGDKPPECEESPTGQHEWDTDPEKDASEETLYCVYCGEVKDEE